MPEDETQETQETQETLETLQAQLEEEKDARAAAQASLAGKDARIAELESQLAEVLTLSETRGKELETTAAELASVKEVRDQAVAKYLNMTRVVSPSIPEGIISGETIEEIDASIEKGKGIVEAVKKAMESEASAAKVPAGAPTRGAISLESMSPREKIAHGIQSLQGGS